MRNLNFKKIIYFILLIFCISPWSSSPIALSVGILMAITLGNPFEKITHKYIHILLQVSIVGLGFGLNINEALAAGKSGIVLTISSIITVMVLGYLIGRLLKIEKALSYLIAVGTAICGGSAIAAVSPIIQPDSKQISLALAIIFTLNSIALFLYPAIGTALHLTQEQFGLWTAVGIHDTSSVVGAANKYGTEALKIATTVKLARALWIIPVSIFTMVVFKQKGSKIKLPWFIALFIVTILLNTYIPQLHIVTPYILNVSKAGLNLTLFLIGTTLTLTVIKSISFKPLLLAILLWVIISAGSLFYILHR